MAAPAAAMRVSVERIEQLFRVSGEVTVHSAAMEARVKVLLDSSKELLAQNLRVQKRLFELETLVDVRTLATLRARSHRPGDTALDPLEMDQYSELHSTSHALVEEAADARTLAMAEFRVVGRQVQLLAINTDFRAEADQGSKRAIDQAFSPSLIGSGALASLEHPTRKSVLIDASFLFSDIPGYSTRLESAYRLPFSIDRANSSFERERAEEKLTTLTARIHFATPRIPAPPLMPSPIPMLSSR